jgi:hypothetical protein
VFGGERLLGCDVPAAGTPDPVPDAAPVVPVVPDAAPAGIVECPGTARLT